MPMDQLTPLILMGFFIFGSFGLISLLSSNMNLNNIKSRKVGDGQHGTARFATKAELKRTFKHVSYSPALWRRGEALPTEQGIVLGSSFRGKKVTALVDSDDVHTLMIGAAGVGKTAFFLYPNIEYACACGMSFLCTDTKGDLYRNYAGIARDIYGYEIAIQRLNSLILNPSLIKMPSAEAYSLEVTRMANDVNQMLNKHNLEEAAAISQIFELAMRRYELCNDGSGQRESTKLRELFSKQNKIHALDGELFRKTVRRLLVSESGTIKLQLTNGQIITQDIERGGAVEHTDTA